MTETKVLPSNLVNTFTMKTREEIEQYFRDRIGSPLTREEIEWYIDNVPNAKIPNKDIRKYLDDLELLSYNEPITPNCIERILG